MSKTAKPEVGVPAIGPDSLLCIGANMAEAANCLLHRMPPLIPQAEGHPFHTKLDEMYDWLYSEGWRLLVETPAATTSGAATKAHALAYDANYQSGFGDELRESLIADLERLAKAERENALLPRRVAAA